MRILAGELAVIGCHLGRVCGRIRSLGLPLCLTRCLVGACSGTSLRVVAATGAVPPLSLGIKMVAVASFAGLEDALVLLRLILRGTSASRIADLHELSIDLRHVKLLRLAIVDRHQVVQLGRWLIQVEGELLLFLVLGLQVVGTAATLVGAAGTPLRVDGSCISMRRDEVVDLGLHVSVDVQVLPEQMLAEGEALKQLVARVRRGIATILLLRLVGL